MLSFLSTTGFAFIGGVAFDPFFRGVLVVLVGVVVLMGSTYFLVATNAGPRVGGLISAAALFGWMAMMGVFWTIYGIGWKGEAESWHLLEITSDSPSSTDDGLAFSADETVIELGDALRTFSVADGVSSSNADEAQLEALTHAKNNADDLAGWRYLVTSNSRRGEAQASADEFLHSHEVFESTADYVPLRFGAYNVGGKPLLVEDARWYDRVIHTLDTTFVHFWHPQELLVIQVQGAVDVAALPGEAPPVATPDSDKPVVSVVMERDRGGPLPILFGGTRVTPALFGIFNGIIFGLLVWSMHLRDRREEAIRAAV